MNNDGAARPETLTDESGRSNVIGMFAWELREMQEILKKKKKN